MTDHHRSDHLLPGTPSIDLAVIAPIPHQRALSARGPIQMALTHLVLESEPYADYFAERSAAGVRVILDNSAFELEETTGQGLAAEHVLAAAERIDATVIISHDVLYDGPATVASTTAFLREVAGREFEVMAVPQGRSRKEWLACYRALCDLEGVHSIGLSKLSVPASFGAPNAEARLECVGLLLQQDPWLPMHLLGGDRSLAWELREHRKRGHSEVVKSNDSSAAFWYAACDLPIDPITGRAERDTPTKPDLYSPIGDDRLAVAVAHVAVLRTAAGLDPED
ncbi:hypothetical protein AB0M43_24065 [Longispora sp. NPDC051575]|uniref:hypothetical protein n=1 Tax=Longispora sp. NPDC051575 TaxID=3154943 RepID=UPI0034277E3F